MNFEVREVQTGRSDVGRCDEVIQDDRCSTLLLWAVCFGKCSRCHLTPMGRDAWTFPRPPFSLRSAPTHPLIIMSPTVSRFAPTCGVRCNSSGQRSQVAFSDFAGVGNWLVESLGWTLVGGCTGGITRRLMDGWTDDEWRGRCVEECTGG